MLIFDPKQHYTIRSICPRTAQASSHCNQFSSHRCTSQSVIWGMTVSIQITSAVSPSAPEALKVEMSVIIAEWK